MEPVDAATIAARLGVNPDTVHTWRKRTKRGDNVGLPNERWTFSGIPVWEWTEVLVWAGASGRLKDPDLRADYAHLTHEEARPTRKGGAQRADLSVPLPPPSAPAPRITRAHVTDDGVIVDGVVAEPDLAPADFRVPG
jgi:hypothetical protein